MLNNRPEFHLVDTAAVHLGAVPFSLYNSSSADQIEYLLNDSGARIVVTEQAFLDSIERARAGCPSIEHVFVVDGTPSLTELERSAAFRAYERRREDGLRYLGEATARAA